MALVTSIEPSTKDRHTVHGATRCFSYIVESSREKTENGSYN